MASITTTRRPHAAPVLADVAIASAAFAGTLALLQHGGVTPADPRSGGLDLSGALLAAGSSVPLVAWRRYPLGVFAVTATAGVVLAGLGYPADLLLGPTAAVYLLAASRTQDMPWTGQTTTTVAALFLAYLSAAAAAHGTFPALPLLHTGLAWSVAWFAGERSRLRRDQMNQLSDRAARAERDAERERLLAIAQERARIARDLHDSAGHAISVIAVRAGAARLRHHQDPARSTAALQAIEDLARDTADEIDAIVSTLRSGPSEESEVEAPPGLVSLETLITHHTDAGLQVTVDTAGTPRPLSRAADQAVYRIVQQALGNAARHGSGCASVKVTYADTAIALTITNPVEPGRSPRRGGTHGLIGMQERATLLGGTLDITHANGVFQVHATIPYAGHRS